MRDIQACIALCTAKTLIMNSLHHADGTLRRNPSGMQTRIAFHRTDARTGTVTTNRDSTLASHSSAPTPHHSLRSCLPSEHQRERSRTTAWKCFNASSDPRRKNAISQRAFPEIVARKRSVHTEHHTEWQHAVAKRNSQYDAVKHGPWHKHARSEHCTKLAVAIHSGRQQHTA